MKIYHFSLVFYYGLNLSIPRHCSVLYNREIGNINNEHMLNLKVKKDCKNQ